MTTRAQATAATGERIVSVAMDCFLTRPFDQVSLEDIAARADVTVQTVLRRFGNKDALLAVALNTRAGVVRAERDAAVCHDVGKTIGVLVAHYERYGDEQLHLLAQEARALPIAAAVQAGRSYHHRWVRRTLAPHLPSFGTAERRRRVAQLIAATDLWVWKVLRRDVGLSPSDTEISIRATVDRTLRP